MAVRSFRRLAPHFWEGVDLADLAVYVLQWDAQDEDWTLDVFTAAETSGDPWIWGDHYATIEEAVSEVPALPEACVDVLKVESIATRPAPVVPHSGLN